MENQKSNVKALHEASPGPKMPTGRGGAPGLKGRALAGHGDETRPASSSDVGSATRPFVRQAREGRRCRRRRAARGRGGIRVRAVVPAKGSRARRCRRAARSREARIRRCSRASVARGPPRTPGPRRSRRQASQTVPARNARVGRGTRRSAPARRVPSALGSLAPAPRRRPRPEGATTTRRRRRMANAPSAAAA